jgi:N utilization substance protein A
VRHKGFLEGLEVGRAEAEELILSARVAAGWISAEDLATPEPEAEEGEATDEAGDNAAPAQA